MMSRYYLAAPNGGMRRTAKQPACHQPPGLRITLSNYSQRSATIGSTRVARREGR